MKWTALLLPAVLTVSAGAQQAFEVLSIKPANRSVFPPNIDEEDPCSSAQLRLTGRRINAVAATLYSLIAVAYNPWKHSSACSHARMSNLIAGAPDWAASARYEIQAVLPDGMEGTAYDKLLQAALADRFNLSVRTELREMPVYLLTLDESADVSEARMAKSRAAGPALPERFAPGIYSSYPPGPDGERYVSIAFKGQTFERLAQRLATALERTVVDRTGVARAFDFLLEYDVRGVHRPTIFTAMPEQLGLRLQGARAPVPVLVVERAERPTGN